MKTVRIGLLAASRIAEAAVVVPARSVEGVEVVAVAARDEERGRALATLWGIPDVFGSYGEMLASGEIDAVYVSTPASHHRRWVLAALGAGLHVLCEKPFAANAADARAVAATGTDRVVMEGFHWRYHPVVDQMRSVINRLGAVRRIEAWFDVAEGRIPPGDIRWNLDLGGGATMDLGCYAIQWARWAAGSQPRVVSATAGTTTHGVDAWLTADLEWDGGISGTIRSSMVGISHTAGLTVFGTAGTMWVDNPLAPQHGASVTVETDRGRETIEVERSSTYRHQLVAFRDAVRVGAPYPTTVADAVANMEIVDACYVAAGMEPRPTYPD